MAQLSPLPQPLDRSALTLSHHVEEPEREQMPRWVKIREAKEKLRAGVYDDPGKLDRMVDACLVSMLGETEPAE